jgi:hypothetical protein
MSKYMKFKVSIILFSFLFVTSVFGAEIVQEGENTYKFNDDGKLIDTAVFNYNQYSNPHKPVLFGGCMIVRDGYSAGDEGRVVTFKSVVISCPNKKTIITDSNETNDFGTFLLNSDSGDWGVALGQIDGQIQHIRIINNQSINRISPKYQTQIHSKLTYDKTGDSFSISGSSLIKGKWVSIKLNIYPDGTTEVLEQ